MSERCERANGQASGPVLTSQILADMNHSGIFSEGNFHGPKKGESTIPVYQREMTIEIGISQNEILAALVCLSSGLRSS